MLRCYILIRNLYNLLLLPLGDRKKPSNRVTHIHLTLSLWIKAKKSQIQSDEVIFESDSRQWAKKFAPKRVKNYVTHAALHEIAWTHEQKADFKCLWRHLVVKKMLATK